MILRMPCGLVMKMDMFQGMVLTMLLRINIFLGNAVCQLSKAIFCTLTRILIGLRRRVTVCSGTSCLNAIR